MAPDDVTGHRIDALETAVRTLQVEAVSQRWLDERFGRLADQIANVAEDVRDMKSVDRSRRLAVYSAVAVGIVSLVTSLVFVAVSLPGA